MEEMKVVGFRDVDFTDDKGKRISGVSLYVIHPEDGVTGQMAEKIFLNSDTLYKLNFAPVVGETVGIQYGRRNRILAIQKVGK